MSAATETIAFLAKYNSWRRGDETLEMPSPAEIGATIDDAVNLLRKHDKLELERDQLRAELATCKDASESSIESLRAEVERLKKQIKDDNRSYGCELRDPYGTIWEQATKDHDRAGKAERALAELREWQAGVIANERLHHAERKEAIARAERAEAELATERAKAQEMRAALLFIAEYGGEVRYSERGDINCTGAWCAEQARAALAAAKKEAT